jgi:murein DD-endopeptidase
VGIKWNAVFENERRQAERMTEAQRFAYFLLLQYGSPYKWGEENPEGADCSGSVCLALYQATGYLVRLTAHDLFTRIFTIEKPGTGSIRAAFFKDKNTGRVSHVAGLVDEGVILNAQEPGARVRKLDDIAAWFWNRETSTIVRGLDKTALAKLASSQMFDVDKVLRSYFEE